MMEETQQLAASGWAPPTGQWEASSHVWRCSLATIVADDGLWIVAGVRDSRLHKGDSDDHPCGMTCGSKKESATSFHSRRMY